MAFDCLVRQSQHDILVEKERIVYVELFRAVGGGGGGGSKQQQHGSTRMIQNPNKNNLKLTVNDSKKLICQTGRKIECLAFFLYVYSNWLTAPFSFAACLLLSPISISIKMQNTGNKIIVVSAVKMDFQFSHDFNWLSCCVLARSLFVELHAKSETTQMEREKNFNIYSFLFSFPSKTLSLMYNCCGFFPSLSHSLPFFVSPLTLSAFLCCS